MSKHAQRDYYNLEELKEELTLTMLRQMGIMVNGYKVTYED